jgi:hypothetical protein
MPRVPFPQQQLLLQRQQRQVESHNNNPQQQEEFVWSCRLDTSGQVLQGFGTTEGTRSSTVDLQTGGGTAQIRIRCVDYFTQPRVQHWTVPTLSSWGVSILKPYLGKDATAVFEKYHRWVNADG